MLVQSSCFEHPVHIHIETEKELFNWVIAQTCKEEVLPPRERRPSYDMLHKFTLCCVDLRPVEEP